MLLEFKDGSQLEVGAIFSINSLIAGVLRDILSIEFSSNVYSFDELISYFKDNSNTEILYCYVELIDENGNKVLEKNKIGIGYQIFVSIAKEYRTSTSGETKEIYIVKLAKYTYEEYQTINNNNNIKSKELML